jgi:hypothetical protein
VQKLPGEAAVATAPAQAKKILPEPRKTAIQFRKPGKPRIAPMNRLRTAARRSLQAGKFPNRVRLEKPVAPPLTNSAG